MQTNPLQNYYQNRTDKNEVDVQIKSEFKDEGTSGEIILFGFTSLNDSSTSISPEEYQMSISFKDILTNCSMEELDEKSSPLINETRFWIEKFGIKAVNLLKMYMNSNYPNRYVLAELFEMLGDVNNQASYDDRKILLESNVNNSMPEIRYGAVLGLANMNSKTSLNILKEAFSSEKVPLISNTIMTVIDLLR